MEFVLSRSQESVEVHPVVAKRLILCQVYSDTTHKITSQVSHISRSMLYLNLHIGFYRTVCDHQNSNRTSDVASRRWRLKEMLRVISGGSTLLFKRLTFDGFESIGPPIESDERIIVSAISEVNADLFDSTEAAEPAPDVCLSGAVRNFAHIYDFAFLYVLTIASIAFQFH